VRVIKTLRQAKGKYLTVSCGGKTKYVHVLVAEAFLGPRPEGYQAHHKNGDRCDNRPENLTYVEAGEHIREVRRRKGPRKLTAGQVRVIRDLSTVGATHVEIAELFGVSPSAVGSVLSGRTWSHVT